MKAVPSLAALRRRKLQDLIGHVRALIFDVDGTLAETEETHRRAFNETFAQAGIPWCWSQATYKDLLRVTGGKERMRAFDRMQKHRIWLSEAEIANLHRIKTHRYADLVSRGGCPLRPGVEALIHAALARGQQLAIATTTTFSNVDALLSVTLDRDWKALFSAVVAGDDVPRKKPAPDVYVEVLARLGHPAGTCLAIEDSGSGLIAAKGARIPVLITRSAYFHDDDFFSALAVVEELTELAAS